MQQNFRKMSSASIYCNFHVHSRFSHDGFNTFAAIRDNAAKGGLDTIAITDHDTMEGAFRFKEWLQEKQVKGLEVILGEEITCDDGTHIIGLFLKKHIPSAPPLKVVEEIKKQNGLVYFPHPARKDGILSSKQREEALQEGHFFEVFNAKINHEYNRQAIEALKDYPHLVGLGGSDAHYNADIRKCQCVVPFDTNVRTSLVNLLEGRSSVTIMGKKKLVGDTNYFEWYYKRKERWRLPEFLKKSGKILFPLYKNFKEQNQKVKLEIIYDLTFKKQ